MAETKNDGGPALPSEGEGHGTPQYHSPGMSLRDWFAGQALMGIISDSDEAPDADEDYADFYASIAETSYALADAMLAERSK